MIARLYVQLPFEISVPDGQQYTVHHYQDGPYIVCVYPPLRSKKPSPEESLEQITIDGVVAFNADVLRIDFLKYAFDRCVVSLDDPPMGLMERAVNSFLVRLRLVGRAPHIRQVNLQNTSWRLQYLNDDETELPTQDGFVKGRGGIKWSFTFVALTKSVWEDIYRLPPEYQPLPWDDLLLDAHAELPNIGSGIVLAATALEVFIARILDQLASRSNESPELWRWINERKQRDRNPSVEEQFDSLLKIMAGHSLKEEPGLWESFVNLKSARNSFVHEGVAKIGGLPIDAAKARQLILAAGGVVEKVHEWLPEDLQWERFTHKVNLGVFKKFARG